MHVAKWGNSLALRLPVETARRLKVKAGDVVEAVFNERDELVLSKTAESEAERRKKLYDRMMSHPGGVLPPDYKFDRDWANSRRDDE